MSGLTPGLPSAEAVRAHQELYPLIERERGLTWHHGCCWLCVKPMLKRENRYPEILRLRAKDGVVELQIGWAQWNPLDTMKWAAAALWEPVDQQGHPLAWRTDAPPLDEWVVAWVRRDGETESWTPAIMRRPPAVGGEDQPHEWHFTYKVRRDPSLAVLAWRSDFLERPAFLGEPS